MEIIFLITICILLLIAIILIILELPQLKSKVADLQPSLDKIESSLIEDFRINREENAGITRDNRAELNNTLKVI
jgi:hypothetical protein